MSPVKCQMERYYKDGVSTDIFLQFLEATYFQNDYKDTPYFCEKIKKGQKIEWEIRSVRENLGALGFLEGGVDTDRPGLSPRGKSLLCLKLLFDNNEISKDIFYALYRFQLLKSITDIDWSCFMIIFNAYYLENKKQNEIHNNYYNYDLTYNWIHRFGFHKKILEQIFPKKTINYILKNRTIEVQFDFDPYSNNFQKNIFFDNILKDPPIKIIQDMLSDSIKLYKKFFPKDKPIGYTEILKTILQCILMRNEYFVNESMLSSLIIQYNENINLYKSSKNVKIMGRGFYIVNKNFIYYPFFDIL